MGDKLVRSGRVLRKVFSRPSYLFLTLIIGFVAFSMSLYVVNFKLLISELVNPSVFISLLGSLFIGGVQNLPKHTVFTLILISILTGMVISLIVFKARAKTSIKVKGKIRAFFGILFGLLAPACASCGLGLISIVGLGSVLVYLPFKGIEVGVLSVLLLLYSVYALSYSLSECRECRI